METGPKRSIFNHTKLLAGNVINVNYIMECEYLKHTQKGSFCKVSSATENNPYCIEPVAAAIRCPAPYNFPKWSNGNLSQSK